MATQLYPHIVSDPAILGGRPIIEGTSLPVSMLLTQVAAGKSLDEVAREHGVRSEDVRAALEFAAERASESPLDGVLEVPSAEEEPVELTPAGSEEARLAGLDPANVSPLGRRLLNIRAEIVASGEPLLTWDELEAELAERRGEHEQDEA